MHWRKTQSAAAALLLAACVGTPALAQPAPPPGEGFAALKTVCGGCHTLALVTDRLRTGADWRRVFEKMQRLGLKGDDDDIVEAGRYVRDYLTAVDVNSASPGELVRVLGVTPAAAEAIVAHRAQRPFARFDELASVPGIDRAQLEARKQKIFFQ